jgi:hypothetical protein
MSDRPKRTDRVEVSSDQLKSELIEIKERLSALETIASVSNRTEVETYVRGCLTTAKGKQIMKECEEPRTKEYLSSKLSFASTQALDYHLSPLRRDDLIQQHVDDNGTRTFEWSNLFKRLPKKTLQKILDGSDE